MKYDRVIINAEVDHQCVMELLDRLATAEPQLKTVEIYWAEFFLRWITEHPEALEETDNAPEAPIVRTIQPGPLLPTPEPHLTRQIDELRRHILIDEKLVRRIY